MKNRRRPAEDFSPVSLHRLMTVLGLSLAISAPALVASQERIGETAIDPNHPEVIWVGTGEIVSGRHVAWGDGGGRPEERQDGRIHPKVNAPSFTPTFTVSPGANSPASIFCASGFSMYCWMARLSGRAP